MYDKELLELKKKLDKMLAPKTAEYKQGYKDGYTKAIDEFVERLKENSIRGAFEYKPDKTEPWHKERKFCRVVGTKKIDEIAEKLKVGAE